MDAIDRQAAIDALCKSGCGSGYCGISCDDVKAIEQLPPVQPEQDAFTKWAKSVADRYRPERKKGKWIECHHAYADEEKVIEEWQSCKCSICGRYDTRPYLYYFSEPRFCSWCGADMRGET